MLFTIQTVNSGLFFYLKIEFLWHEALPKNSEGTVIVSCCREIGLYGPLGGPQFYKALLDMPLLRYFFLFEFTEKIAFNRSSQCGLSIKTSNFIFSAHQMTSF